MLKVLQSAIANARVKADKAGEPFRENDLYIKETYVDEGVTLKRFALVHRAVPLVSTSVRATSRSSSLARKETAKDGSED